MLFALYGELQPAFYAPSRFEIDVSGSPLC